MTNEINLIGMLLSAIFYELTGIVAGGFIAPSVLSRYSVKQIIYVFITGLAIWITISLISNFIIIYGRRKFTLCIILSILISIFFLKTNFIDFGVSSIIPGLIASNFESQGIVKTASATILLTFILKILILTLT